MTPRHWLAGVLVWLTGLLMDRGLGAWTRHPNYFGDTCVRWGLWLITITPREVHAGPPALQRIPATDIVFTPRPPRSARS